jgi:predicted nucleic acid-binding Zn finger protein
MTGRIERAVELAHQKASSFNLVSGDVYRVPGSSRESYLVDANQGHCTCPDYQKRILKGDEQDVAQCKHVVAIVVALARKLI